MFKEQNLRNSVKKIYNIFMKRDSDTEGRSFQTCTNGANWLQENYFETGHIVGYFIKDNPTALIGKTDIGHDFLVVNFFNSWYIIDFWYRGKQGMKYTPIMLNIDTQEVLVKKYYGDITKWNTLDGVEFKHLKLY